MIYLSPTTDIPDDYKESYGVMFSAKYPIGGLNDVLESGWQWMMDNNAFSGKFDTETWLKALLKYIPYRENCLGIPIPDKVGDALETLRLFSKYYQVVSDLKYKVAFVTQDGITPEITPWNYFDTLFVGGTNDHKLSNEATIMIAEAKHRGKLVHIGRVNSPSRIKKFWMADSVDGTTLTAGAVDRPKNIPEIHKAVMFCRHKKSNKINSFGQYTFGVIDE